MIDEIDERIVKNIIVRYTPVDEKAAERVASIIVNFCREYKKIKEEYKLDTDTDKIVTSTIYDLICYGKIRLWLLGDRNGRK